MAMNVKAKCDQCGKHATLTPAENGKDFLMLCEKCKAMKWNDFRDESTPINLRIARFLVGIAIIITLLLVYGAGDLGIEDELVEDIQKDIYETQSEIAPIIFEGKDTWADH